MAAANTHNKCFVLDNFILYYFFVICFISWHLFSPNGQSSSKPLSIWLNENGGILPSFSRHGRIKASFILLIWLNENVGILPSFSRHGRIKASFILLIWLNENVFLMC